MLKSSFFECVQSPSAPLGWGNCPIKTEPLFFSSLLLLSFLFFTVSQTRHDPSMEMRGGNVASREEQSLRLPVCFLFKINDGFNSENKKEAVSFNLISAALPFFALVPYGRRRLDGVFASPRVRPQWEEALTSQTISLPPPPPPEGEL